LTAVKNGRGSGGQHGRHAFFFPRARRWVVVLMAVALGWSAAAYLPALMAINGRLVILLLALGGGLYSLGGLAYALKRPDPWPRVFGYHEVFHALVVIAAFCHFAAIALAVPAGPDGGRVRSASAMRPR
jgi:hemolysin III